MDDRPAGRAVRHLTISGRVQGVWYRGWTVARAAELGLDGWVRNRRDGTVEALVAGPTEAVERLIADCRQGPPSARVTEVRARPAADGGLADPGPGGFHQRATR